MQYDNFRPLNQIKYNSHEQAVLYAKVPDLLPRKFSLSISVKN